MICTPADEAQAGEVRQFIRTAFRRTHAAEVRSFMPSLLWMSEASGELRAAAGYRAATHERLFLERYLLQPIELALAQRTSSQPRREQIVEVGNFACANQRVAREFISHLPAFLLQRGFSWITFTATRTLRRILEQQGAHCLDLGPADGACATNTDDDWGRYYSTLPRVMAGYLPLARRIPALWNVADGD